MANNIGFAATGPTAGSIAAAAQSMLGNVAPGTVFASLQSLAMSGQALALLAAGADVVGLAGARAAVHARCAGRAGFAPPVAD